MNRGKELGLDPDQFAEALDRYIAGARDGDFSSKEARELIADRRAQVSAELEQLGPSVEKCETFLNVLADDADLDGSDNEVYGDVAVDLRNQQRKALAGAWRDQWAKHRDNGRLEGDQAFWVSADFQDRYDDIAYYRVYERYGFGEFDGLFDDVAKRIGESLAEDVATGDAFGRYRATSAYRALGLAENVWLVSRSARLRLQLHLPASAAIASLYYAQRDAGWWPAPAPGDGGDHPPSAQATAMAVIAGARISADEDHHRQIELAVTWLMSAQEADGSWKGPDDQADLLGTALALEAIAISRRAGARDLADRAAGWLLTQQLPHGTWRGQLPTTLMAVTVLSAIRRSDTSGREMPADLAGGLALLRRGRVLGLERSIDARQLAVIAAYTALEAVLYALLGHADFSVATVRGNGQSIGLDDALHAYESRLVELGRLEEGKHVNGHSTLRSLSHVRDGVIHRGTQPSPADTERILTSSARFVSEQVASVFEFDPAEDW